MTIVPAPSVIDFPNGYGIHVHEIWRGQVLYQVWPPGIETQQWPNGRCFRRPVEEFAELVVEHGGKYA